MSDFSSPAPKRIDDALYKTASPGLRRLMEQSRKELRQKAREEYWQMAQQAQADADTTTASSTPAAPATTGTEAV